jgi:hypothetical protein
MQAAGGVAGTAAMVPVQPAPMVGGRPIGNVRNPIVVLLLSYVCFVYAFIAGWSMLNELKNFRGRDDINPILFIIPILNLILVWQLPPKVLEAKQMAGVPNPQVVHPILYLLLWPYFFTADLNEVFQAASSR